MLLPVILLEVLSMKKSVLSRLLALLVLTLATWPAYPQGRSATVTQPMRSVQMQYMQAGAASPDFKQLWPAEAKEVDPNPPVGPKPQVFVGHVRDASGSLLTITMLAAREECGPNLCPIRIFRDGKLVKEFSGCNEVSEHRISADGRYLLACDAKVEIPKD